MQRVPLGHIAAGDGPTLVAVHGGLLSGRLTFGTVLADWAQRFRVLVPDRRGFEHDFFAYVDPRALGRIEALVAADDPGIHVALDELRVWRTPLSPAGLAGVTVPVLVVTGARIPAAMHSIGENAARVTSGRHHVQRAAGHAAHLVGRPFRDVLCAHVADAEARRAWRDPVELVPHDPSWARWYAHERAVIAEVLGDASVEIAHIGSTAVAGLAAKPVIDLMVGVTDAAATRPAAERLRAAGYAHRDHPDGDNTEAHVFALRRADGRRLAHAHVVVHGDTWWNEHLAFRDLLRDDPELRRRYEEHKRALAGRHHGDREAYTDAKTGFVTAALHAGRADR